MKNITQLVVLLLAALFLLTACNITPSGTNDDTTADTTLGDDTTTGGDEVTPEDPSANDTTTGGDEGNDEPDEEQPRVGSAVNHDGDAIYYFLEHFKKNGEYDVTDLEEKAREWFEYRFTDCGISDMIYNISMTAPFKSDDPDLYDKIDKYYTTEENGIRVNYKNNESVLTSYLVYEQTDVDPYQVWFEQCRENGMNPWLSFRMNDVHYANERTGLSPFQYKARQNGWLTGNYRQTYWNSNQCTSSSRNWYAYALNYAIPQVRERFLKEIEDRLSTYDAYGIELDWHRQIWCFPKDEISNCKYINELMEEVNKIVEKYEGIYGHDIKISVRLNRDIDEAKYFGFDVRYWAQNGWLDVIEPGSYWGSTDSDIPIEEWLEEMEPYGVEVWPSLESHVMAPDHNYYHTVSTMAGYTAQYLSRGAHKMHLYNLFTVEKARFSVCASIEAAQKAVKRSYVVTESNCTPYNVGIKGWDPLPIRMSVNQTNDDIVIKHGTLKYNQDTVIYVGLSGVSGINEDTLVVKYNGVECEYRGESNKGFVKSNTGYGTIVAFKIPQDAVNDSVQGQITFESGTNLNIIYVELMNGNSRV